MLYETLSLIFVKYNCNISIKIIKEKFKTMIKNIIFDVGNVLLSYRWKEMLMKDHGMSEEDAERVGNEMFDSPYWAILDLGTETDEQVLSGYAKIYPEDEKDMRWFIENAELMKIDRPKIWELVHKLKEKGYHIYYLSNYSKTLFNKHTGGASFFNDMEGGVVSYEVNMAKPDIRIYKKLIDKYDLVPEECLFFDDLKANVEGAIKAGMQSKVVTSEDALADMLKELL